MDKIFYPFFYPLNSAAVNDLLRTLANSNSLWLLILWGFCELLRMVADSVMVSPAGIEPATSP
ncbi:hypothetical protein DPD48_13305 [Salmonella enterica subsp. enterica]|nr:hypothetical protein [Salmonella enterica subsp. enterica serovar Abony]